MSDFLTQHRVRLGDARDLGFIPSESVHLVCSSPPYGNLIEYPKGTAQLGNIASYELFLDEMDKVLAECLRILVPGGRLAWVIGDICISRRKGGRHHVLPLAADVQVRGRRIGFDNLTPIRWFKVANIRLEASKSSRFLGKPNLPNGVVKNDIETIVMLRKPGGYRKPTGWQEKNSLIPTEEYTNLFCSVWDDVPGQIRSGHPAPYPVEIPRRLVRMFSFVADTVVDPFAGTGTTAVACMELGRNSISVEIERSYVDLIQERLQSAATLFTRVSVVAAEETDYADTTRRPRSARA